MFHFNKHKFYRLLSIVMAVFASTEIDAQIASDCISLDGSGYVFTESNQYSYGNMTVELWAFKEDWTAAEKEIVVSNVSNGGWEIYLVDGKIEAEIQTYSGPVLLEFPSYGIRPGWHHLSFTKSENYLRLFIDGTQRDYYYNSSGLSLITPSEQGVFVLGAGADTLASNMNAWVGHIDEVRIWERTLTQAEIGSFMHFEINAMQTPVYIDALRAYFPFSQENHYRNEASLFGVVSDSLTEGDSVSFLNECPPLGDLPIAFATDVEAIWNVYGNMIYSESSNGLHVAITNGNELELSEYGVFGNNNLQGVSTIDVCDDVDMMSNRIWYYNAMYDYETVDFRFDMSDAGAYNLLDNCLSNTSYKLLFKSSEQDSFEVTNVAYMLDGDNLFFCDVPARDGYYSVGRDNEVPNVSSSDMQDVVAASALGGGTILCNGGASVVQYGLCWALSSKPTILDSISVFVADANTFVSRIENLIPGYTYFVRAYAINSEGVGYGDEKTIQTAKLSQSVVFPSIDQKYYGEAMFSPGAYASSNLAVSYRVSDTSIAVVENGMIRIVGIGTTTIWASQPGNISYNASPSRKASLTVLKGRQTIVGLEDIEVCYGDTFTLSNVFSSSGLPILFSISDTSLAQLYNDSLLIRNIGETTLVAVQPGNENYLASPERVVKLKVNKRVVDLMLEDVEFVYDGTTKSLDLSKISDSLKVMVTYNDSPEMPVEVGTYNVLVKLNSALLEGSDSAIIVINKAESSIVQWPRISEILEGESLGKAKLSGGNTLVDGIFTFSDTSYVPKVSGESVTVVFTPQDTVNYKVSLLAQPVHLVVVKVSQTIVGMEDIEVCYGDTFMLSNVSSSSGLPILFSISDTSLAQLCNDSLLIRNIGETTLVAVQPGNENYFASPDCVVKLKVKKRGVSLLMENSEFTYDGTNKEISINCINDSIKVNLTYNDSQEVPVAVGKYKVVAMLDNAFLEGSDSAFLVIKKAEPNVIQWPYISDILEGESLVETNLVGGVAEVDGRFELSDSSYIPLMSGELVPMLFIPDDTVNYRIFQSSQAIYFSEFSGTEFIEALLPKVYPTVTTDVINVSFLETNYSVSIYDLFGRTIDQRKSVNGIQQFNMSGLKNGIYIVRCFYGDRNVEVKIIKTN